MPDDVRAPLRARLPVGRGGFRACVAALAAAFVALSARIPALADAPHGTVVLDVLDQNGAAVPFAGLYYGDADRGITNLTSADPAGKYVAYQASSPFAVCGYAQVRPGQVGCVGPLTFTAGATYSTDLVLKPSAADQPMGTIVLTVRDAQGKPVPYAEIPFNYGEFVSKNYADAQGRRIITGPVDKPAIICARSPVGATTPMAGCVGPVVVAPGSTSVVDLPLHPSPAAATSADPAPAHGSIVARVLLNGSQTPVPGGVVRVINTPLTSGQINAPSYVFPGLSTTGGINGGPVYVVALTPPPGYGAVGGTTQQVTLQGSQNTEADFFVLPSFSPFWVQSFAATTTEWSGPDDRASPFGTRAQWSYFLVVAKQDGPRLLVYDPTTSNYAWIDASAVGPSGPPPS